MSPKRVECVPLCKLLSDASQVWLCACENTKVSRARGSLYERDERVDWSHRQACGVVVLLVQTTVCMHKWAGGGDERVKVGRGWASRKG
jgi:hypothetical protein